MRKRAGGTAAVVLVLALVGCSVVTRAHRAMVLEPPTQGEGDPLSDRWVVLLRLDDGDVLGSEDVLVGFDRRALLCDDGSELAPRDLEAGTVVRFVREGEGVDTSDPPGIGSREIRAEC